MLFLCVYSLWVNFFFIKDFSGTTAPRILKFGTNIGYDLYYVKRESASSHLSFQFICPFFCFSIRASRQILFAPTEG